MLISEASVQKLGCLPSEHAERCSLFHVTFSHHKTACNFHVLYLLVLCIRRCIDVVPEYKSGDS